MSPSSKSQSNVVSEEKAAFEEVMASWSSISKELLHYLQQRPEYLIEDKEADSLMALGALEVHLKLAIQAHNAAKSN